MTLTRNGPLVPVKIWFGKAIIGGEEQDRGLDWRCEINGVSDFVERDQESGYFCRVAIPVDRAWPFCSKRPVTEAEYRYLVAHAGWARDHAPDHPKAQPRKPVDFHTLAVRF